MKDSEIIERFERIERATGLRPPLHLLPSGYDIEGHNWREWKDPFSKGVTHGRHCPCSACAAEDWTRPELACCGMHGPTCPAVYAPLNSFGIPETLPHEISEDE